MVSSISGVQLAAKRLIHYVQGAQWYHGMSLSLGPDGWVIKVSVDANSINKAKGVIPNTMEGYSVLLVPARRSNCL